MKCKRRKPRKKPVYFYLRTEKTKAKSERPKKKNKNENMYTLHTFSSYNITSSHFIIIQREW